MGDGKNRMKKGEDELDAWMKGVMKTPAGRALREEAESSTPLHEEILARYHAGMLTADEEAAVRSRIALNEANVRFLAGLESDIGAAGEATPPQEVLSWRARLSRVLLPVGPFEGLRLAGAAAAAILLVLTVMRPGGSPPWGPVYDSPLLQVSKGENPGETDFVNGVRVERVDPMWTHQPDKGPVARVEWLVWNPLPGDRRYHVTLYGPSSDVPLFEQKHLSVPYVKLPGSTQKSLHRGTTYTWVVETEETDAEKVVRTVGRFEITSQ